MNRSFGRSLLAMFALVASLGIVSVLCVPTRALADVPRMPDVTEQMSDPAYWYDKVGNPNAVLADAEQIAAINAAILSDSATNMNDLAAQQEGSFDGVAKAQALKNAAEEDAQYFYNGMWARYLWDEAEQRGVYLSTWEEAREKLYGPMIDNAYDSDATTDMPYRFGICTTRTCVRSFPSDARVLDAPDDPDFDYQYQTMVRVGEPLVIDAESDDGAYYHVAASCTWGWVAACDVAVCASKAEWLDAWQFDAAQTLVVLDDKVVTEESAYAPAVSQKMLPMGTCLKLATPEEYGGGQLLSDVNRAGYNCHVVWMPIRNEDGSYARQLALISEHCKVSEGFLPLTYANIAKVALNQLGDEYGWGGMLSSDDCSGYVRDMYKCFGLELARNTTWQAAQPVRSYSFEGMDTAQRTELIGGLPLGTVLFFSGHEMLYLGSEGDNLYVISSVSSASLDGASVSRLRGAIINTLDVRRGRAYGFATWLDQLSSANIPYLWPDQDPDVQDVAYECTSGADAQWLKGSASGLTFVFDRNSNGASTLDHFEGLVVDGKEAQRDVDYTALWGSAIVELAPGFLESLEAGEHSLVARFDDAQDCAVSFATQTQEAPQTHAVLVGATDGGFVGVSTGVAEEGTTVTVTCTPQEGFFVQQVTCATSEGGVELAKVDETTYTFAMPAADVTVQAQFAPAPATDAQVRYQVHVQTYGTLDWASDGAEAGTTGESKRMESVRIELVDAPCEGSLEYRAHVQGIGWEKSWRKDGALSGTEGKSKRLEAIQVRLTGQMAERYDVWYRVHAQTYGWLGWAKNGDGAGTVGFSKRLEAMQVLALPKGSDAPGDTAGPLQVASVYRTHVQGTGWLGWVIGDAQSGTTGQSKRLEGINLKLADSPYEGSIQYRTHVQTYGWEDGWRADGAMSGTEGQSKRLEAIQIRLTGQMAEHFDVRYRVHVQGIGWMDWVSNGKTAGTTGQAKRLESIMVQLVPKAT